VPERRQAVFQLPLPQRLVVGDDGPGREDGRRAAAAAAGAAAHRDDAVAGEERRQLDGAAEQGGVALADGGIGVERVPGCVHADELDAVVAELACQPVALACLAEQSVEVEVVGLLPAADPHLDVADVAVGAPAQRLHAR
jgi:hypothetical protein